LRHLEASRKLEPTQPVTLCEMALVHVERGDHEKAIALYDQALETRPWISDSVRALVLRGKGVRLIDLGDLDAAKGCLMESLRYAPGNEMAINELFLISNLKTGVEINRLTLELRRSASTKKQCEAYDEVLGQTASPTIYQDVGL
jgi:tetratricopeptide (TPR) repeat protein